VHGTTYSKHILAPGAVSASTTVYTSRHMMPPPIMSVVDSPALRTQRAVCTGKCV